MYLEEQKYLQEELKLLSTYNIISVPFLPIIVGRQDDGRFLTLTITKAIWGPIPSDYIYFGRLPREYRNSKLMEAIDTHLYNIAHYFAESYKQKKPLLYDIADWRQYRLAISAKKPYVPVVVLVDIDPRFIFFDETDDETKLLYQAID